jgi:hypothetical protein
MDKKQQIGKIIVRNSLYWGWAMITPPVVMVVLDLMEKHTPTSVAITSSMFLMIPFIFSNASLSQGLAKLTGDEVVS